VAGEEGVGGFVEVVWFAEIRLSGFMADDGDPDAGGLAADDEIADARERFGIDDARAVADPLHLSPVVLAIDAAEVVADGGLVGGYALGDESALAGQPVEEPVVADDGVVEIDPNEHSCSRFVWPRRG